MAVALRRAGLPIEVQSESDLRADSPAYAWLTALSTIMVEPQNHYEIVGVLREVYGLSDHDLAVFAEGVGARFQIEKPPGTAGVVGSPMAELAALRESIRELPLFAAIEQIIAHTALRARLAALPADDFKDPLGDLDALLTHAAQAGATGARLADFVERLRSEMEYQRAVRLSDEDAIQLITAHKAKGLEWDAVIVPFLGRQIREPSPAFRRSSAFRAATKFSPPCTRKIAKPRSRMLTSGCAGRKWSAFFTSRSPARVTLWCSRSIAVFFLQKPIAPPINRS
jgi:ATP-dependent exoDNAse (exonuclease V) beta subunit (contains helicase and exonuclease domains)